MMRINSLLVCVKYFLFTNLFNCRFGERSRSRPVMTSYVWSLVHHPYVFKERNVSYSTQERNFPLQHDRKCCGLTFPTEGTNCPYYVQIEFTFSLGLLNDKFCLLHRLDLSHLVFKTSGNRQIQVLGNEEFSTMPSFSKMQAARWKINRFIYLVIYLFIDLLVCARLFWTCR